MKKVIVIQEDDGIDFKNEIEKFINIQNVIDIKFAVTPNIESGGFSSYSLGQVYYAMIIYEV